MLWCDIYYYTYFNRGINPKMVAVSIRTSANLKILLVSLLKNIELDKTPILRKEIVNAIMTDNSKVILFKDYSLIKSLSVGGFI